jgi:hypothetical protein
MNSMNKIKKVWLRISNPYTLNKNFTASFYKELIEYWKEHFSFINFHSDPGDYGIILRHDIDSDLDKAVRMAEIEAGRDNNLNRAMFEGGDHQIVRSTYFVLNTAKYWNSLGMIDAVKTIQDLGHEIGWHNNAITEYYKSKNHITPYWLIKAPLDRLRGNGITIRGTAAHGDRLCYTLRYINYNVFGFESPGWDGYRDQPKYKLSEFGLEYEAYHVPFDYFLADNHYGWHGIYDPSRWTGKRVQVLIHPAVWRL